MFKKISLALLIFTSVSYAAMFQTIPLKEATIIQTGKDKIYCPSCGMHLGKFYKTNHTHKNKQYCSMHCLVENNKNKMPSDAKVVDTKTLKFIDASKAFYVVGSKKKGTMTMNSKYAFALEADAKKFKAKNGGKLKTFKEAFEAGKDDFKKDMMMIGKKRGKKVYKMGKKIFETKCQQDKIDVNNFNSISQLKASIRDNKLCGKKIKDKQLQVTSVYLWDIKKLGKKMMSGKAIRVPKKAKCPVCGMFVAKYPKWVAKIRFMKKDHYFDGVKDMMKFIFDKQKNFKNVQVTDYYTTTAIKAQTAFYVVGSNVYGPMGNELIPFSSMNKAKEFKQNHYGTQILTFDKITKELTYSLDK